MLEKTFKIIDSNLCIACIDIHVYNICTYIIHMPIYLRALASQIHIYTFNFYLEMLLKSFKDICIAEKNLKNISAGQIVLENQSLLKSRDSWSTLKKIPLVIQSLITTPSEIWTSLLFLSPRWAMQIHKITNKQTVNKEPLKDSLTSQTSSTREGVRKQMANELG